MPLHNNNGSSLIENIVSLCLISLFSAMMLGVFSSGITAFGEIRETHQTITSNFLEIETSSNLHLDSDSSTVLKLEDGLEIEGTYIYSSNGLLSEFTRDASDYVDDTEEEVVWNPSDTTDD